MLVLLDESPTSRGLIEVTFAGRRQFEFNDCVISYKTTNSWTQWQRIVLQPDAYDVILMPLYHALKDDTGAHVSYAEVIRWTSKNSAVPVFATQDYAVGDDGVVGACAIFGEDHGRMAALLVKGILEGEDLLELSVANDQKGTFYFNRKQLEAFRADNSSQHPGSGDLSLMIGINRIGSYSKKSVFQLWQRKNRLHHVDATGCFLW